MASRYRVSAIGPSLRNPRDRPSMAAAQPVRLASALDQAFQRRRHDRKPGRSARGLDQLDRGPRGVPQLNRVLECRIGGGECVVVPGDSVVQQRGGPLG